MSSVKSGVERIMLFGVPIDAMSMERTVELITQRIRQRVFTQHVVVNVAKLVTMQHNLELAKSVHSCDIVNADGMGVVWAGRLLGHHIPERVAGIDLFGELLCRAAAHGYSVFLLGATEAVVEQTVKVLKNKYQGLEIAGFHHGYFAGDEEAVVKKIALSGARLLFVAMTSPTKEQFIDRWGEKLGVDFVMGVGGTFDIVAGKTKRAPLWMQRSGLEWLYRVYQEPRRMWRRYLVTNVLFARMLLGAITQGRQGRKCR